MANKILIIGVGSAGVIAADKMDLPNSKKLFVDSDYHELNNVESDGEKIHIMCKERDECSSLYCHCYQNLEFCKRTVREYEEDIKESIKRAFMEKDF